MSLGFGIMGAAAIANKNVKALVEASGVHPAAVASRQLEKAADFRTRAGVDSMHVHASYEELLADPTVDAVYVPLPTSLHAEWVPKVIAAGKHVLLEKPLSLQDGEAEEYARLAKEANVVYMDGTMWSHHPRTHKMKEVLTSGELGTLRSVNSSFHFYGGEDFGTSANVRVKKDLDALGCLGDVGWYCIRATLWAFDWEMPVSVLASSTVRNDDGVLMRCAATMEFPNGKFATFDCGFMQGWTQQLLVAGTLGTLRLSDIWLPLDPAEGSFTVITGPPDNQKVRVEKVPSPVSQEGRMFEDFAECVRGTKDAGTVVTGPWPDMATKTQQVVLAVYKSAEKGVEVRL